MVNPNRTMGSVIWKASKIALTCSSVLIFVHSLIVFLSYVLFSPFPVLFFLFVEVIM